MNAKNEQGGAPLHYAAYDGHKNIVELLIAKSANVNDKDLVQNSRLRRFY